MSNRTAHQTPFATFPSSVMSADWLNSSPDPAFKLPVSIESPNSTPKCSIVTGVSTGGQPRSFFSSSPGRPSCPQAQPPPTVSIPDDPASDPTLYLAAQLQRGGRYFVVHGLHILAHPAITDGTAPLPMRGGALHIAMIRSMAWRYHHLYLRAFVQQSEVAQCAWR